MLIHSFGDLRRFNGEVPDEDNKEHSVKICVFKLKN